MPTTLDYFKSHPLRVAKNQRAVPIHMVRQAEKQSVMEDELHPTTGAFIHYGGVELADMLVITAPALSQSELDKLAMLWYKSCGRVAKQLLFYTWQIIAKELRHGSSNMTSKAFSGTNTDPEILAAVHAVTSGGSYMGHVDAIGHKPVGLWVDAVERHFRHGGWGGAYGGKKWADIAVVFQQYIDGTASAMLAADRAWTLVHNTGPIFNKGFYFKLHDGNLAQILNAQAVSSVFDMKATIYGSDKYQHEALANFIAFSTLAEAAIQTVKPDYNMGSSDGVTSDGQKGLAMAHSIAGDEGPAGTTTKTLGPIKFYSTQERPAE